MSSLHLSDNSYAPYDAYPVYLIWYTLLFLISYLSDSLSVKSQKLCIEVLYSNITILQMGKFIELNYVVCLTHSNR